MTNLDSGSGFDGVIPTGISNNGKITGAAFVPVTGELHAFVYENGVFTDLGMMGYTDGAVGSAINNAGQVAGTGYGPGYHAVLYTNGHVKALGSIDDNGNSYAIAMNRLGHVVGRALNGDGGWQGFSYLGSFKAVPVEVACGINDSDQIVGSYDFTWMVNSTTIDFARHGFIQTGPTLTDVGNLGGGTHRETDACAINNAGQVTGNSTTATGAVHAFIYNAGVMTDLGGYGSWNTYGVSINSRGDVVGHIGSPYGGEGAFLYSNGQMKNLTDLLGPQGALWTSLTVSQINDSGWIIGTGSLNGVSHSFLAKPRVIQTAHPYR